LVTRKPSVNTVRAVKMMLKHPEWSANRIATEAKVSLTWVKKYFADHGMLPMCCGVLTTLAKLQSEAGVDHKKQAAAIVANAVAVLEKNADVLPNYERVDAQALVAKLKNGKKHKNGK